MATVDSCSFIEQNEQLFTESEALTVNNLQEDVVVRQGSSLTLGVEENTLIAPTAYLLKNCQEPVQAVPLRPTAESKLSSGWIVNQRNPEAVGATGTVTVDQTFEAGKKHVLFVYSCRWIEEEEEKGWDCHGDDENPSKWMMISFTVGSCTDGVKNDDEADVDCGGSCGSTCVTGKRCQSAADCQQTLSCGVNNQCTPFCSDGKLSTAETDIDCGGSCGATCLAGKLCQQNTDCQQGLQCDAQKKCATPPVLPPAPPPVQAAQPVPQPAAPVAVPAAKVAQKRPPRFWATGVTSKDQQIVTSEDGGKTWKVVYSVKGKSLRDITFSDKKVGFAVGPSGKILKTTDAGTTWVVLSSGTTADLYGMDCADVQTCWFVGGKGTILKTVDGGKNFVAQASSTEQQLEDVFFIDQDQGWAVGGRRYILHTTDGGLSWEKQDTGWGLEYKKIQCIDVNCWVVAYGIVENNKIELIQTWDGGVTWQIVPLPKSKDSSANTNAIQFVTFDTGYAFGSRGRALKTTDGGLSWQDMPGFDARWSSNHHFFIDEKVGCSVGYTGGRAGRVFCTSDGGKTWTQWGEGSGMYFFYGITGRS